MIEGIQLHNFQCHQNVTILFDEHITTITGPSDIGKSSIIRGLLWVFLNQPAGSGVIRDGSPSCQARVKVDKGVITKSRGKTSEYRIKSGKKTAEYKAFGSSVPEDIQQFLKVSGINFQKQHDAAFWLSLSPGQVSRELNAIVDLSIMDNTVKVLSGNVRELEQKKRFCEGAVSSHKEKVESLHWVPDALKDLGKIEHLADKIDVEALRISSLRKLADRALLFKEDQKDLSEWLLDAQKICQEAEESVSATTRRTNLYGLVQKAKQIRRSRGTKASWVKGAQKLAEAAGGVIELERKIEPIRVLVQKSRRCQKEILVGNKQLEDLQRKLPRRCPLCQQTMS